MRRRHDYSSLLIWAAVLVTVVRYAGAFVASDLGEIQGTTSLIFSYAMGLTGLGMGFLDVLGGAYIFEGWRRAMPRAGNRWPFRFIVLTAFVFSLFSSGIGILVPYTVSRVSHTSMEAVLGVGGLLWIWSLLVNIAPYILIGGVVTGNVGMVTVGGTEGGKTAGEGGKATGKLPETQALAGKETGQTGRHWRDWRDVPESEYAKIAGMKPLAVLREYQIPDRTARNWVARAKAVVGEGRPLQEALPILSAGPEASAAVEVKDE